MLIMSKHTIKDIANLLDISTSTVSRALSDHPDISDETKKRVKDVAEGLNYKKNLHASLFRKNKSGLISLILPEINMFYTPQMINSINKLILPSNYSLEISLTNDQYQKEKEIIDKCIQWQVEGVIMSLSRETKNQDQILKLKQANIPCVLLDKTINQAQVPTVTIDNIEASKQAAEFLIQKGHRNIIGVFGSKELEITNERIKGFKKAIAAYGIKQDQIKILSIEKLDNFENKLTPILKNKKYSAIFTMSDELLSKCVYVLQKSKIQIPDDISIISISDGAFPYLIHPNISHIKDSGSKMGKNAAKMLLNIINENNPAITMDKIIPTKLVCLNSVKNIMVKS